MKILDRYILLEWIKIFAIALGVTLGILVMHDMYGNLGHLIEWGTSTEQILLYYVLFIPTLIPLVLPISLLLSLIYLLGSLHRNNEITAMRASGMNVFRITRSLWIVGFLLSILMLWLTASVIPQAKQDSRLIYESARFADQLKTADASRVGLVPQLGFNNRRDGRLWYMNSFSQVTNRAHGVSISVLDKEGREASRIMAREGVYDDVDKCWYFLDGHVSVLNPETRRTISAKGFEKLYFRDFKENPKIMVLSMKNPKDLSLFETKLLIDALHDDSAPESLPYLVRWYSVWASSFVCIIVVAIAIPFSVSGVRTNPMVGVSKTVGLFFLYYIIDSILTAMGGRGIISPLAAAVIPNAAMLVFALSLYRKAI